MRAIYVGLDDGDVLLPNRKWEQGDSIIALNSGNAPHTVRINMGAADANASGPGFTVDRDSTALLIFTDLRVWALAAYFTF